MATTEISAKTVMQLRASTGLPMMKCKEALEASGGDFDKAVEWLRKKGLETAAKKADRAMKEGRVALRTDADGKRAAMVEVDCETEPVRDGPDFKALVDGVLEVTWAASAKSPSLEDVLAAKHPAGETVDTTVKHLVARIGENMQVRRVATMGGEGRIGSYLHHNHRVGVLVQLKGDAAALGGPDTKAFLSELGMQIAAQKPVAVTRDEVSAEIVEKEKEIYRAQLAQDPKMAGKPPQVLENILKGRVESFFAERCLMEQVWVKDTSLCVKEVLESVAKKAGGSLSIARFVLFQVGAA